MLGDGAANRGRQVFMDQGLRDEVTGTRLQCGLTDAFIVHRCEYDDLHGRVNQSELPARLYAVSIRQRDIQNDDVGLADFNEFEQLRHRCGVSDQVAVVLEHSCAFSRAWSSTQEDALAGDLFGRLQVMQSRGLATEWSASGFNGSPCHARLPTCVSRSRSVL